MSTFNAIAIREWKNYLLDVAESLKKVLNLIKTLGELIKIYLFVVISMSLFTHLRILLRTNGLTKMKLKRSGVKNIRRGIRRRKKDLKSSFSSYTRN